MSVKMMTADQLRDDLRSITLIWPDGVPFQQVDRVAALKAELKRRGEPLETTKAVAPTPRGPDAEMTTEDLEAELRKLSVKSDEDSQKRFADVRFELRRRAKVDADAPGEPEGRPKTSPVTPRALELPDDVAEPAPAPAKITDSRASKQRILAGAQARGEPVPAGATPSTVVGWAAYVTDSDPTVVLLEYEKLSRDGIILLTRRLDVESVDALVRMLVAARDQAAANTKRR